jgi:hypothetical protein
VIVEETDTHRARLEYDQDSENPRLEWDGVATSYIRTDNFPRDTLLPGESRTPGKAEENVNSLGYAYEHFAQRFYTRYAPAGNGRSGVTRPFAEPEDVFARWARIFHGWDIGVVSRGGLVWYTDPELAEKCGATMGTATTECEVNEYESWAKGEVYGYIIEEGALRHVEVTTIRADGTTVHEDSDESDWVEVDGCWGFIGHDYAVTTAKRALADYEGDHS